MIQAAIATYLADMEGRLIAPHHSAAVIINFAVSLVIMFAIAVVLVVL
jgi:hypothetical protein